MSWDDSFSWNGQFFCFPICVQTLVSEMLQAGRSFYICSAFVFQTACRKYCHADKTLEFLFCSPQTGVLVSWVPTPCVGGASRRGCWTAFAATGNRWTWSSARRWGLRDPSKAVSTFLCAFGDGLVVRGAASFLSTMRGRCRRDWPLALLLILLVEVLPLPPWVQQPTPCAESGWQGSECRLKSCFHFDALQLNLERKWQMNASCVVECPVNCQMSEWSPWSDCSQTCGLEGETRTRGFLHVTAHRNVITTQQQVLNERRVWCNHSEREVWSDQITHFKLVSH